jgi:YHS domain-containing protein
MYRKILFGCAMAMLCACNENTQENTQFVLPAAGPGKPNSLHLSTDRASADTIKMEPDPVCGMAQESGYEDTTCYNGKIYGFCSAHCKKKFLMKIKKKSDH